MPRHMCLPIHIHINKQTTNACQRYTLAPHDLASAQPRKLWEPGGPFVSGNRRSYKLPNEFFKVGRDVMKPRLQYWSLYSCPPAVSWELLANISFMESCQWFTFRTDVQCEDNASCPCGVGKPSLLQGLQGLSRITRDFELQDLPIFISKS